MQWKHFGHVETMWELEDAMIPIFVLILRKHQGWCYSKGEGIIIPTFFTWNVFNQNYVNDVNMLVWIPSVDLKTKARLVNG